MSTVKLRVVNTVLGIFKKGVTGSYHLSFATSGSANCDICCPYHPFNENSSLSTPVCYAYTKERAKIDGHNLLKKLQMLENTKPSIICNLALNELKNFQKVHTVKWLRFSAFGSVPKPENADKEFCAALLELVAYCNLNNIKIHFPVESMAKVKFYTELLNPLVTVRWSAPSEADFINSNVPVSMVVGTNKQEKSEKIKEAKLIAKVRFEKSKRKTIVCPAIVAANTKNVHKAKCGNCTACSNSDVDVIYPSHF